MKKGLIFDPYLDTLGGGEAYCSRIADYLVKTGFNIEIAWKNRGILNKINSRFGLNLENRVKINEKAYYILKRKSNLLKKYLFTKNYQIIFFLSDGSIPFLFGEKNYLHFQSPFAGVNGDSFLNQLKLKNISKVICNSYFTKKYIDKEFKIESKVMYPPINSAHFNLKPIKKENIILSVGRFDEILNSKKQDVLINVFKKMVDHNLKNWRLVLLGGLMKESKRFNRLKRATVDYPIEIMTNVGWETLMNYYQKAKIYWHGAGFGEDLKLYPQRAEHFGISIVEAMAADCVPVVFNGGGAPEIIDDQTSGYLWKKLDGLEKITLQLIKDKKKIVEIAKKAKEKSKQFSQKVFEKKIKKILNDDEKDKHSYSQF